MVEISKSGSGEGPGQVTASGYSTIEIWQELRYFRDLSQAPTGKDSGIPRPVIRFRILQAINASVLCDSG